jgi:hypothetical protein
MVKMVKMDKMKSFLFLVYCVGVAAVQTDCTERESKSYLEEKLQR